MKGQIKLALLNKIKGKTKQLSALKRGRVHTTGWSCFLLTIRPLVRTGTTRTGFLRLVQTWGWGGGKTVFTVGSQCLTCSEWSLSLEVSGFPKNHQTTRLSQSLLQDLLLSEGLCCSTPRLPSPAHTTVWMLSQYPHLLGFSPQGFCYPTNFRNFVLLQPFIHPLVQLSQEMAALTFSFTNCCVVVFKTLPLLKH